MSAPSPWPMGLEATAVLVANPASSRFKSSVHRQVVSILKSSYRVSEMWPRSGEEAERLAASAARQGVSLVVAAGGDGLVQRVASGLVEGRTTALGVIPIGTTNVLARSLGIPRDARAAARVLTDGPKRVAVPIARLIGEGDWRTTNAVSQIGVGLDARVAAEVDRHPRAKRMMPQMLYGTMLVRLVRSQDIRQVRLRVQAGALEAEGVAAMIQVRWPYTYLGSLPVSFTARPTSGLDLLLVEELSLPRTLAALTRMVRTGSLDDLDGLTVWPSCGRIRMWLEAPAQCHADGEILVAVSMVEVSRSREPLMVMTR